MLDLSYRQKSILFFIGDSLLGTHESTHNCPVLISLVNTHIHVHIHTNIQRHTKAREESKPSPLPMLGPILFCVERKASQQQPSWRLCLLNQL